MVQAKYQIWKTKNIQIPTTIFKDTFLNNYIRNILTIKLLTGKISIIIKLQRNT